MSLSLRDKQSFYHSLAQLIRTGIPFPTALDKLAVTTRGQALRLVKSAREALTNGRSVGEAFAAQHPAVTPLESSILAAVEKSGQLDRGLSELSTYFGALAQARETIVKRIAYPVLMLHLGILILAAPTFVLKGAAAFFHEIGSTFIFLYAAFAIIAMLAPLLRDAGESSGFFDRLLNAIPLLGKLRRCFALSRFCTVYGLQLDAGVNIIDSLIAAGRASRSGSIRAASDGIVSEVRGGAQVGPLLAASGAFPMQLTQAIVVGEDTGKVVEELKRLAEDLRAEALSRLETLAFWLPKLIYIGVVLFMAWKIVGVIQGSIAPMYRDALGE